MIPSLPNLFLLSCLIAPTTLAQPAAPVDHPSPAAKPAPPAFTPVKGQRIEAYWVRQWWSATVRDIRGDQALIRHDQRAGSEEWVPTASLRKFTKGPKYPLPATSAEIADQDAVAHAARDARLDALRNRPAPTPRNPRANIPGREPEFTDADTSPVDTSTLSKLTDNPNLPLANFTPDPEPAPPKSIAQRPMPLSGNPRESRASSTPRPASIFIAPTPGHVFVASEVPGFRPVQLLQRFDAATGNPSPVLPIESSLTPSDISPDGTRLVGTNKSRKGHFHEPPAVEVWSLADKQPKLLLCFTPDIPDVDATFLELARFIDHDHVLTLTLGNLICWSIPDQKAVYHRKLTAGHGASLATSPTGKYLASSEGSSIRLYESATGSFLGTLPKSDPPIAPSHLSFSPSGKRLLATEQQRLVVFDLTTASVVADISLPTPLTGGLFLSDDHVLVQGRYLVDLTQNLVLWDYPHGEGPFYPYAGRLWYVPLTTGTHTPVLYASAPLPTPEAKKAPDTIDPNDLYALLPGAEVSLNLDIGLPADQHAEALNAVRAAAQKSGWKVTDNAPTQIRAAHSSSDSKEIEYRMFGGERRKVGVSTHTYTLTVEQGGNVLYQTQSRIGPSMFIHLKKDESIESHLDQQRTQSAAAFFKSTRFPKRLAKPTPTPGLGQTPLPGATPSTDTPKIPPTPSRPTPTTPRARTTNT